MSQPPAILLVDVPDIWNKTLNTTVSGMADCIMGGFILMGNLGKNTKINMGILMGSAGGHVPSCVVGSGFTL